MNAGVKHLRFKENIFFDSFGLSGLKKIVIQDHKKLIYKTLTDGKLTQVKATFSRSHLERLMEKELGKLNETAAALFHYLKEFGKLHNVHGTV